MIQQSIHRILCSSRQWTQMILTAGVMLLIGSSSAFAISNYAQGCSYITTSTIPDASQAYNESSHYPDTGGIELTDGLTTTSGFTNARWVGYAGQESRVITIDLKRQVSISYVTMNTCQSTDAGIYFPRWIGVSVSADGKNWSLPVRCNSNNTSAYTQIFRANLRSVTRARYVQVQFQLDMWVFVCEISVMGDSAGSIETGSDLSNIVSQKRGFLRPLPPMGWSPQDAVASGQFSHMCLMYSSGNSQSPSYFNARFYVPYAGYVSRTQIPQDTMFDAFLFLPTVSTPNYYNGDNPALMADWSFYVNSLFMPSFQICALEQAVGYVRYKVGQPDKVKVVIVIPYPSAKVTNFGDPTGIGRSLNFASPTTGYQDRLTAVSWYIDLVLQKWQQAKFTNLELIGFYWYEETIHPSSESLVRDVADMVHDHNLKFYWIPYFHSTGYRKTRDLGFDCAMMQPNMSFSDYYDATTGFVRLKNTAKLAAQYGLGMEMEVGYNLSIADTRNRYLAYLDWGRNLGYMNGAAISYYQNVDSFNQAAKSIDPAVRNVYDATYRFIKGLPK